MSMQPQNIGSSAKGYWHSIQKAIPTNEGRAAAFCFILMAGLLTYMSLSHLSCNAQGFKALVVTSPSALHIVVTAVVYAALYGAYHKYGDYLDSHSENPTEELRRTLDSDPCAIYANLPALRLDGTSTDPQYDGL